MKFITYLFTLYPLKWLAVFAIAMAALFGIYDYFNGDAWWWVPKIIGIVYVIIVVISATWELVSNRNLQRKPWNR